MPTLENHISSIAFHRESIGALERNKNPIYYKVGDLLLLRNPSDNKMEPIYLGPYLVLEDCDCNVKILKNGKVG